MLLVVMALLYFAGIDTPSLTAQGGSASAFQQFLHVLDVALEGASNLARVDPCIS